MTTIRRVGHKGASLIAPGNTLASFDAALAAGVDMIEFDILPARGTGELILAHDPSAARRGSPPTLEEGLAHLASPAIDPSDTVGLTVTVPAFATASSACAALCTWVSTTVTMVPARCSDCACHSASW